MGFNFSIVKFLEVTIPHTFKQQRQWHIPYGDDEPYHPSCVLYTRQHLNTITPQQWRLSQSTDNSYDQRGLPFKVHIYLPTCIATSSGVKKSNKTN